MFFVLGHQLLVRTGNDSCAPRSTSENAVD